MKIIPGRRMKWRSLYAKNRWFRGKVYAVSGEVALVKDETGRMYPHFVAVSRLVDEKAVEIEL